MNISCLNLPLLSTFAYGKPSRILQGAKRGKCGDIGMPRTREPLQFPIIYSMRAAVSYIDLKLCKKGPIEAVAWASAG